MPIWLQDILVLLVVGGGGLYLCRQGWLSMTGRRSRLGSCCAKGCGGQQAAKPATEKPVAFIPVEMLGRKR